uniref:Ig-like domain-containing protein n=1 Tax=Glossina brevipalpis TaxID=37001 RepID=A0A1A9X016_9MUSC
MALIPDGIVSSFYGALKSDKTLYPRVPITLGIECQGRVIEYPVRHPCDIIRTAANFHSRMCYKRKFMLLNSPFDCPRSEKYLNALLEGASKRFFTDFLQDLPTPGTGGPTFDTTVSSNITGLVGKTVKLTCRVKNLGNRTHK